MEAWPLLVIDKKSKPGKRILGTLTEGYALPLD